MSKVERIVIQQAKEIKQKYDNLTELIHAPEIIADSVLCRRYSKQLIEIEEIALLAKALDSVLIQLEYYQKELEKVEEKELKELISKEIQIADKKVNKLVSELKVRLLVEDEQEESTVILQLTAVEGKELAMRLCEDMVSMYTHYTQQRQYKVKKEIYYNNQDKTKYAILKIKGKNVYTIFEKEEGEHKIISKTNTATVTVIATKEDTDKIVVDTKDMTIELFHSSGAGGQNVNKVESAVRATHTPTGIVTVCQDERSQLKNKQRAIKNLSTKVYEYYLHQKEQSRQAALKESKESLVWVRSYDYNKGKVYDKRSKIIQDLKFVLKGKIDNFLDALILKENSILPRHTKKPV